jgi:hypothetical protein
MRKILLTLLFAGISAAQQSPTTANAISTWPFLPTSRCLYGQTLVVSNVLYLCYANNTWQALSGGGGSPVSVTASSPIIVTPNPLIGIGAISCPSCNTGSIALSLHILQGNNLGSAVASSLIDDGTTVSTAENFSSGSITAGGTLDATSLGTPSGATQGYCHNCTIGACATLGIGAYAFWNPGAATWTCPW